MEGRVISQNSTIKILKRTVTNLTKKVEDLNKTKNKTVGADEKQIANLGKKLAQIENKMTTPSPSNSDYVNASSDVVVLPKAAFDDYLEARNRQENHNMSMASNMVSNQHHLSFLSSVNQGISNCNGNPDALNVLRDLFSSNPRPAASWGPNSTLPN